MTLNPAGRRRAALVTGAASGIGRAVAVKFIQSGISVVATDSKDFDLVAEGALPEEASDNVVCLRSDVRNANALAEAAGQCVDRFGRLDIAAAIAGIILVKPFQEISNSERDLVFEVNVAGVWNTIAASLPAILESPGPRRLLLCGSVASVVAAPGQSAYVATKHAVVGLAKALAVELGGRDVTVNVVSPSGVATEMLTSSISEEALASFAKRTPIGRLSTPEEVASLFTYLAGEDAGYITGENIIIDGGSRALNVRTASLDISGAANGGPAYSTARG